jgi:hypothetical protein
VSVSALSFSLERSMTDAEIRALERAVRENDTAETRLALAWALQRVGRLVDAIDSLESLALEARPDAVQHLHDELRASLWKRAKDFPGRDWRAPPGTHYVRVAAGKLEWAEDDGPPWTSFTNGAAREQAFADFAAQGPLDPTCPESVVRELAALFHVEHARWFERLVWRWKRDNEPVCPACGGTGLITDPAYTSLYRHGGFFDDTPEGCSCGGRPDAGSDEDEPDDFLYGH